MPLLDAISTYLAAAGLGLIEGTNLFKSDLPDGPDVAVALYEYGGQRNEKVFIPGPGNAVLERPSFQVVVRGARINVVSGAYSTARATAESIYLKLDGYAGTLSGVEYKWVECASCPRYLKTDENHRPYIVADYEVQKAIG